jgi:hypothetical protein
VIVSDYEECVPAVVAVMVLCNGTGEYMIHKRIEGWASAGSEV